MDPSRSLATFEAHRRSLLALAYRMLGDLGRAEDVVQEATVRAAMSWRAVASFLLDAVEGNLYPCRVVGLVRRAA